MRVAVARLGPRRDGADRESARICHRVAEARNPCQPLEISARGEDRARGAGNDVAEHNGGPPPASADILDRTAERTGRAVGHASKIKDRRTEAPSVGKEDVSQCRYR